MHGDSVKGIPYGGNIDKMFSNRSIETEAQLLTEMRDYGLSNWELDLVKERVFKGRSMEEIQKTLQWTSKDSLTHHWREVLRKLRRMRKGI